MVACGDIDIGYAVALSVEGATEGLASGVFGIVASNGDPFSGFQINILA